MKQLYLFLSKMTMMMQLHIYSFQDDNSGAALPPRLHDNDDGAAPLKRLQDDNDGVAPPSSLKDENNGATLPLPIQEDDDSASLPHISKNMTMVQLHPCLSNMTMIVQLPLSKMTMMVQLRFRFSKDDVDNATLPSSL